jgi:hypothetical protein
MEKECKGIHLHLEGGKEGERGKERRGERRGRGEKRRWGERRKEWRKGGRGEEEKIERGVEGCIWTHTHTHTHLPPSTLITLTPRHTARASSGPYCHLNTTRAHVTRHFAIALALQVTVNSGPTRL